MLGEHDLIDPDEVCTTCYGKGYTISWERPDDGLLTKVQVTCYACRGRGCQTVRVDE